MTTLAKVADSNPMLAAHVEQHGPVSLSAIVARRSKPAQWLRERLSYYRNPAGSDYTLALSVMTLADVALHLHKTVVDLQGELDDLRERVEELEAKQKRKK
jgi:hypothetical protein